MNGSSSHSRSSIGKKQLVAATGLFLILFVVAHLAGNLFIYGGPEAFNGYAKKLVGLRPGLYFLEAALLVVFLIHLDATARLVLENLRARPTGYRQGAPAGDRQGHSAAGGSFASRLMPWTGAVIVAFVIWHLLDFTFVDRDGPAGILPDGRSYGLFGVVYNSLGNPVHCVLYIAAMLCVGTHLSHGIQSFIQTFGLVGERRLPAVRRISNALGIAIALAYSSIPIYVQLSFWVFSRRGV
ncbi:MAG: succinate dehydrogenase cytochrome b subunit [Candidatus Omnitrophica bacterium]|nr:succinate dehydrogenase cytochrome b subunit [Candidatus Omnitrophota bacterium]